MSHIRHSANAGPVNPKDRPVSDGIPNVVNTPQVPVQSEPEKARLAEEQKAREEPQKNAAEPTKVDSSSKIVRK